MFSEMTYIYLLYSLTSQLPETSHEARARVKTSLRVKNHCALGTGHRTCCFPADWQARLSAGYFVPAWLSPFDQFPAPFPSHPFIYLSVTPPLAREWEAFSRSRRAPHSGARDSR